MRTIRLAPGEAPADYWTNTRYGEESGEAYEDPIELFYQDVPRDLAAEAFSRGRAQSETRMEEPLPLMPPEAHAALALRSRRVLRPRRNPARGRVPERARWPPGGRPPRRRE